MPAPQSTALHCLGRAAIIALAVPSVAQAEPSRRIAFDLPAQPLGVSIRAAALLSGRTVLVETVLVGDRRAPALKGYYTLEQALTRLLEGTGLGFEQSGGGYVIRAGGEARTVGAGSHGEIVVTGSRIRGAPVASPVVRIDQEQMREAGQTGIGDVVRAIPQNFGGGQNPGVGNNVPSSSGINVGGATTINLRGLGSDATLTLINGHRLAYNGSRQGVDVSAIPLAMVDRIEIVADGASALYGSDAVAGVANVILKRDYQGLETRADIGGSTEGGHFRQQYGALVGRRWGSGGLVAAYEYARESDIVSDQRAYAASRPGVTLYPAQRRHAAVMAGHQALGEALTFRIDALFNKRWSTSGFPLNAAGDLDVSRAEKRSTSRSLALAPSLELDLASGWRAVLAGVYGEEKVRLRSDSFVGDTPIASAFVCYCNSARSAELAADGPLFALPGGAAKLAIGAGYRDNLLDAFRAEGDPNNVRARQDSYYLYGEIDLPLVSPAQGIAGIDRLHVSGAIRYERYPGIDAVATPKIGVIYAPLPDIAVKASWGRSFRAPTLFQQYQARTALLYPAASLGGVGYPAGASALLIQGGNSALRPERARTWTATIEYQPRSLEGLRLQAGYFSIRYAERIVTPIAFQSQALSDPLYADQVVLAPDSAAVAAAIADAAQFFNVSGSAYDPARVVAIIDNTNLNAGRQTISGLDVLAEYRTKLGETGGTVRFALNASYIESSQQLTSGAPVTEKAGTLFNPPHWRGRASVTWTKGGFTLNAAASRIGGVEDTRSSPVIAVDGMTTLDLTARYAFKNANGPLRGLELSLTAQNLLNDRPDAIATTFFSDTAYDSTNYSPVGRYLGIGIARSW